MNTPYHLIKPIWVVISMLFFIGIQYNYSQTYTDTIPVDTLTEIPDSIHPFHRKKGDVLNYLLVDNFNNPALAGSLKSYQAQASYGNTLPGSSYNYHYGQIMLDMFLGNKQGRHGLAYRLGIKHIGFSNAIRQRLDYSFQCINKRNFSLRFGVGVGFLMEQLIKADLIYADMIDQQFGFIYSTQESSNIFDVTAFKVSRFNWNVGAQLRIYDGYLNIYNTNDFRTNVPDSGNYQTYYPGLGINALYNVNFRIMQFVPSIQFNYWAQSLYLVQGGFLLASNTSKGGGGGVYYNTNHIFTLTGLFAWNDYLRVQAQIQFPFSDLRYTYPVSNFQITVSYKINDFSKYE